MLEIGMALRLKGIADSDVLTAVTGVPASDVDRVLSKLVAAGHASETPRGFRLTPEGKAWLDGLLDDERSLLDQEAMGRIYDRFCVHNEAFKQLVTDWQLREVDGEPLMNDHSDAEYDAAIIARLEPLHAAVTPVLTDAAARAPRLSRYIERLTTALEAIRAGEHSMLAAPLKDSYHTVWFELHEDLILLTGRTRAGEAAAGRGA